MADKPEIDQLALTPCPSSILSETRSSLMARTQRDAARLSVRKQEPVFRAIVKINDKWGVIDKTGRFIVPPLYSKIGGYACGRASFSLTPQKPISLNLLPGFEGDRWDKGPLFLEHYEYGHNCGYFDATGAISIQPRFENVRQFREDLAGVKIKGKWGFINKQGATVVEPRFTRVRDFVDGLAIVELDAKYGSIDRSGHFVIRPDFDQLSNFSEGLACAEVDGKYGYLDRSGVLVISPLFESAGDFTNGISKVKRNGKWCFLNPAGSTIFQCDNESDDLREFVDGVAWVDKSTMVFASTCGHDVDFCDGDCEDEPCTCDNTKRRCGECSLFRGDYIDRTGKSILKDPKLIPFGDFSEGLGVVALAVSNISGLIGEVRWLFGYIDNHGTTVLSPQFESAGSFKNGRAVVCSVGGHSQYIDKTGQNLESGKTNPEHLRIGEFHDGLARIRRRGAYGFMDRNGKIVISPKHIKPNFLWAGNFRNGLARVRDGVDWTRQRYGYIDATGHVEIPIQFEDAKDFELVEL